MKSSFIGCGAAGNKAIINLIEKGVVSKDKCYILNSTIGDVPAAYRDRSIIIGDENGGGCGKEREVAKRITMEALEDGTINVSSMVDPDDDTVTIVTSTEGGTGSGSSIILARAFKDLGLPIHIFVFSGFEDDSRGLKNTVSYFKDLDEDYTVQVLSNKKFLDFGNRIKAEKMANDEFANRMMIYLGLPLVNGEQNIDATDHYKIATTPGFTDIEYCSLEKIKNMDAFNKVVSDMIDNTKSIDFEPNAIRLGIYLNISDKTTEAMDFDFSKIKAKMGNPFELFLHVQHEEGNEWVAIMASGIKIPGEEVEAIYKKYIDESSKVNKNKDTFFNKAESFKSLDEDDMFDIGSARRRPIRKAAETKPETFPKVRLVETIDEDKF